MFQAQVTANPTNWPDVAAKSLDMLKSTAAGLEEAVRTVAPQVLEAVTRQVILEGIENLIWGAFFGGVVVGCYRLGKFCLMKCHENKNYSAGDWATGAVMNFLVGGAFLILMFVHLFNGINYLANPKYWVVMKLLSGLKGGGR